MQDITVWKVPVYPLLLTQSQGPRVLWAPIVWKALTDLNHAQRVRMAHPKDCKAVQAVLTVMEGGIVILRGLLRQMALVILDSSARSVLSDLILSILAKVEVFVPQDTTAQEEQQRHSNALQVPSTMRHMQRNHQTVFPARLENIVRVMVTPTRMASVMRDGTAIEVLMQEDLFPM